MNARSMLGAVPIVALLTTSIPTNAGESSMPADPRIAAESINALGIDLLREGTARSEDALLSPYSLQTALAMAYAGSDGDTRREMAAALYYPVDEAALHGSIASLRQALDQLAQDTAKRAAEAKKFGGPTDPVELTTANRLFGQQGYDFREEFLDLLANTYAAPLQLVDYIHNASGARIMINDWVEDRTHARIHDLLPPNALDDLTRLVLVNAVYLKAPWQNEFSKRSTEPRAFELRTGQTVEVSTMLNRSHYGYRKDEGFQAITVPYSGGQLHCLILLPDEPDDLPSLEAKLTSDLLVNAGRAAHQDVRLHLPKFRVEPPVLPLSKPLQALGMTTAFDVPRRTANFDRMAPRRLPGDYLLISEVFHKTFLSLDESGTEAAAATAVLMAMPTSAPAGPPPEPIEVKVDRPFLFAIQHRSSGACLFLGRVTDPRP